MTFRHPFGRSLSSESSSSFSSTTNLILAESGKNWRHSSRMMPIHFVLSSFGLEKCDEVEKTFMMSCDLESRRKSISQPKFRDDEVKIHLNQRTLSLKLCTSSIQLF
jgi:hypothetical protein